METQKPLLIDSINITHIPVICLPSYNLFKYFKTFREPSQSFCWHVVNEEMLLVWIKKMCWVYCMRYPSFSSCLCKHSFKEMVGFFTLLMCLFVFHLISTSRYLTALSFPLWLPLQIHIFYRIRLTWVIFCSSSRGDFLGLDSETIWQIVWHI